MVFASALLTGQLIPTSIDPDAVRKHYLEKGMESVKKKQSSLPAVVTHQSTITGRLTRQGVKRLRQGETSSDYHNVESEDLDVEPMQNKKKKPTTPGIGNSPSIKTSSNHASLPKKKGRESTGSHVELEECRELVDKAVCHVESLTLKRDSKNKELQAMDTEMAVLKARMAELVKEITAREGEKVAIIAEIETMEKGLSFWTGIANSTGI